jgi:hypothetical protein
MVEFVRDNPAIRGMQSVYDMQAQQGQADLARIQLDEAISTRNAERAVDDAYRNYIGSAYGSAPGVAQAQPQGAANLQAVQPQAAPQAAPAPGPAATAGAGDAPGFQAMLQQVAPSGAQMQPLPNATPGMGPGAATPVPNATPGMQPQMQPANLAAAQPMAPQTRQFDRRALAVELAKVPGAGGNAMALIAEQEAIEAQEAKDKDHAVENFFKSIDAGDVNSAHYWAQKSGMELPPDALADAELVKHLGIAGKWKALFGKDLEAFGNFTSQYFNALEAGQTPNPYSLYAANKPTNRGGAGSDAKIRQYQFLVAEGVSAGEAMQRVWSGGAAGGMKYSEALKIATDVLTAKIEAMKPQERRTAYGDFDAQVEALAQKYMGGGGEPTPGVDYEAEATDTIFADLGGREIYSDDGQTWYFTDDDSPVPTE